MDEWIVCTDWTKFQHYDPAKRQPPWIKNYTDLLHKDDYLNLSGDQRAVLHGLWLTYASARCHLRLNTSSLSRRLGLRVMRRDIEALENAGFVEVCASAVHARRYPSRVRVETETETELETEKNTLPSFLSDDEQGNGRKDYKQDNSNTPRHTNTTTRREQAEVDW